MLENRFLLAVGDVAFASSAGCDATGRILYEEHFEDGDGGFTANNTGGEIMGLWHYSAGRRSDGLPNHTPIHSWYYGAWETATGAGQYPTYPENQGELTSPWIPEAIPATGETTLTFSYLLGTRPELDRDFVEVSVLYIDEAGNQRQEQILARSDGTLPQTGNAWRTAAADLSRFGGKQIRLEFFFGTGDAPVVDPEGWYVDDIVIRSESGAADFGDAPGTGYATLAADGGACHAIVNGFRLGTEIDGESDGQPTPDANGDDVNPPGQADDEDGVVFLTQLVPGTLAEIEVAVSASGKLDAWIDFGDDGSWAQATDQIFSSVDMTAGVKPLTFLVPADAALGTTYARFRFSSVGGLPYGGPAADGEVEDYRVVIERLSECNLEWQNSALRFDVNNDGWVNLTDALWILDDISALGQRELSSPPIAPPPPPPYWDVSGDCWILIDDAQTILNFLNSGVSVEKLTNGEDADQGPGPLLTVGEAVEWTYTIESVFRPGQFDLPGVFPVANVTVMDNQIGEVDCVDDDGNGICDGDANGNSLLDPGETWMYLATGVVAAGEYENVGSVLADRSDTNGQIIAYGGSSEVMDSDTSHYTGAAPLLPVASAADQQAPSRPLADAVGSPSAAAPAVGGLATAEDTVFQWFFEAGKVENHSAELERGEILLVLAFDLAPGVDSGDSQQSDDVPDLMFNRPAAVERQMKLDDTIDRFSLLDETYFST